VGLSPRVAASLTWLVTAIAFLDFLNTFEQAGRPARSRTSHSMTAGLLLRR